MAGQPEQHVGPDECARHLQRQVTLPQVQHVGAGRAGGGQLVARLQRAEPLLPGRPLVAQLDDVHAAGQGGVGELGQIAALPAGVGAQVEPRGGQSCQTLMHTATLAR